MKNNQKNIFHSSELQKSSISGINENDSKQIIQKPNQNQLIDEEPILGKRAKKSNKKQHRQQ